MGAFASAAAWLAPLQIDELAHPERLPVLVAIAVVASILTSLRPAPAIDWPLPAPDPGRARRWPEARALLGFALRTACLLCLAIVLCEPVAVRRAAPEPGLGRDLVLVLDASASMGERDAASPGAPPSDDETSSRLSLARRAVAHFAEERVSQGDRVGLVVFGEHAFTAVPLTSDPRLLASALSRVEVGVAGEATALGDALALAVKRLASVHADPDDAAPALGGAVVLLTDGRHNSGRVPVDVATALAASAGARVHTVGIGAHGSRGRAPGEPARGEARPPDAETLARIARTTGGRFFAVREAADLRAVYAEIDSLERRARLLPARLRQSAAPEPLLAAALALLLGEWLALRVWRRSLP